MLTKEEIRKKLEENPNWELPEDATEEEWDIYLEVKRESEEQGMDEEYETDEDEGLNDSE